MEFPVNEEAKKIFSYSQFDTRILTSCRGTGKTFLVQDDLRREVRKHNYFLLIREKKNELEDMLRGGFWDANLEWKPDEKWTVEGNRLYLNGECYGVGVSLTTYCNARMSGFSFGDKTKKALEEDKKEVEAVETFCKRNVNNLTRVFFDEFEPLKPQMPSSERFKAFLHICDTFIRFRKNCKVTLCANLERFYSPFLSGFNFGDDLTNLTYGIHKSYTRRTGKKRPEPLAVWCHLKPNKMWAEMRDDSYVGKIIRGTEDAMFTSGEPTLGGAFRKMPAKPLRRFILFNVTDGEQRFTYWKTRENIFYFTRATPNTAFRTYAFNMKFCGAGTEYIPSTAKKHLLGIFNSGRLEFEDASVYERFINLIPAGGGSIYA